MSLPPWMVWMLAGSTFAAWLAILTVSAFDPSIEMPPPLTAVGPGILAVVLTQMKKGDDDK